MYAIRQTYSNFQTGEHWIHIVPYRWKTRQAAQHMADKCFSWRTRLGGGEAIDNADAEVIEVSA